MMEADSTTSEIQKAEANGVFPFPVHPRNLELFFEILDHSSDQSQLVQWLQKFGLLPKQVVCPKAGEECQMVCRAARVLDRVHWVCDYCGSRQNIRHGSFFHGIACSIIKVLQVILAWCEDADYEIVAQNADVKPRVAYQIYEKLDKLAEEEQSRLKLGGQECVVLSEVYPDCLNRLSPDTTELHHSHRILMLADTNHIPTRYWLHVMKYNSKTVTENDPRLVAEVREVISRMTSQSSMLVAGHSAPILEGATTMQTLMGSADVDTQRFLSDRIWRQAVTICTASRDICARTASLPTCAARVQRYLASSLYKIRYGDGFYRHTLQIIAERCLLDAAWRELGLNVSEC